MSKGVNHNDYHINKQNNTATFQLRDKHLNNVAEFIIDADDLDIFMNTTWTRDVSDTNTYVYGSKGESILKTIVDKYTYANNKMELNLVRLNKNELSYRKTNLVCVDKNTRATLGQLTFIKPRRNKGVKFLHTYYSKAQGGVYVAAITMELKGVLVKNVTRSFGDSKYSNAKERAIYAAYLFEKEFYGDNFPEEEYARKEEAFKVLDKTERAEVEDAIVEQLEKLRLARKKIDNYYQSQTLAAKLASGEVIVRPDWKVGNVEESEEDAAKPEPEPKPQPQPEPELAAVDYTIKCSKHLLNSAHQKRNTGEFVHVNHTVLKSGSKWISVGSLPKRNNIFNVTFTEGNYTDARAMATYSAYLFEKLVYGDNFPKTEYNRKLEVIKTLSTKEIEFVNERVAGKLEKVYTILKEMASEKSNACEPPQEVDAEKSADEFLEQIKQTPLKDDALETAAVDDELFAERFKRIEIPERNKLAIQQAIAEMKQKPSLFQRIKNWFTN